MFDFMGLGQIANKVFDRVTDKYEWDRGVDRQNELLAREERLQREFAQSGIQWRVEDARKAGLHPVFALSGGGAAYSSPSVSVSTGGADSRPLFDSQDLSRSAKAVMTPEQRALNDLQRDVALSQIQRNQSEANMFDSITNKNTAAMIGPGMPPAMRDPNVMADPRFGGDASRSVNVVDVKPSEVTSYAGNDPSTAAGKDVMWKKFKMGNGREWWLPNASNAGEAIEALSESFPLTWMAIRENMARNPQFLYENMQYLPFNEEIKTGARFLGRMIDSYVEGGKRPYWDRSPRERGLSYRRGQ